MNHYSLFHWLFVFICICFGFYCPLSLLSNLSSSTALFLLSVVLAHACVHTSSDSKCSFARDCGFGRGREYHLSAEIAFHIEAKTRFGQLKNLSNAAVSSRIGHILNHRTWVCDVGGRSRIGSVLVGRIWAGVAIILGEVGYLGQEMYDLCMWHWWINLPLEELRSSIV